MTSEPSEKGLRYRVMHGARGDCSFDVYPDGPYDEMPVAMTGVQCTDRDRKRGGGGYHAAGSGASEGYLAGVALTFVRTHEIVTRTVSPDLAEAAPMLGAAVFGNVYEPPVEQLAQAVFDDLSGGLRAPEVAGAVVAPETPVSGIGPLPDLPHQQ